MQDFKQTSSIFYVNSSKIFPLESNLWDLRETGSHTKMTSNKNKNTVLGTFQDVIQSSSISSG